MDEWIGGLMDEWMPAEEHEQAQDQEQKQEEARDEGNTLEVRVPSRIDFVCHLS